MTKEKLYYYAAMIAIADKLDWNVDIDEEDNIVESLCGKGKGNNQKRTCN